MEEIFARAGHTYRASSLVMFSVAARSAARAAVRAGYRITHELGHHVQNLLGILPKVQRMKRAWTS